MRFEQGSELFVEKLVGDFAHSDPNTSFPHSASPPKPPEFPLWEPVVPTPVKSQITLR